MIIVSGLPRSGTSMMMKMLEAGGLEIVTDNLRIADDSNPRGYYEFERVKKMPEGDTAWVKEAQGKVVKVISALLEYLPAGYHYKVIFLRRNIDEILASQRQMLAQENKAADPAGDEQMANLFKKHLAQVENWLAKQTNMDVLYISYNDMLKDPTVHIPEIHQFLGGDLDIRAMNQTIDPQLYRQRA